MCAANPRIRWRLYLRSSVRKINRVISIMDKVMRNVGSGQLRGDWREACKLKAKLTTGRVERTGLQKPMGSLERGCRMAVHGLEKILVGWPLEMNREVLTRRTQTEIYMGSNQLYKFLFYVLRGRGCLAHHPSPEDDVIYPLARALALSRFRHTGPNLTACGLLWTVLTYAFFVEVMHGLAIDPCRLHPNPA